MRTGPAADLRGAQPSLQEAVSGPTRAPLAPGPWLRALPLQLLDMKIFVDTDSDIRLVRRLRRDISERGRDIEGVIKQYNKFVKPAFDQYIQPTMRLADIVVPRGEPAGPSAGAGAGAGRGGGASSARPAPSRPRERKHRGHRPDRAARTQPAGGGEPAWRGGGLSLQQLPCCPRPRPPALAAPAVPAAPWPGAAGVPEEA